MATNFFLKSQVEKAAKETGCTVIEIISAMQATCAKLGDEKSISILAKLKWEYIK